MKVRVGFGFDVHQLQHGIPLTLGGIVIPSEKGSLGHSDADVIIHAICDALLGSAGLKDIGFYFPDTEDEYKGIDSKILLKRTMLLIHEKNFTVGNIDVTICLEKPKIKLYIDQMRNVLAGILKVTAD